MDEEVACKELIINSTHHTDVVVIVTDASNLKRHLLLVTQIIDLKKPCILALNMIDEATKNDIVIYYKDLEHSLGIPIVAIDARNKKGIEELKQTITTAIHSLVMR